MPIRYTRALLTEAARETTNLDEAVRWCGGDPTPGSRSYLRTKMSQAGIDIAHFTTGRVRHTEETLRELVACSRSVAEVVRRLGINPVGGNQAHIGRRITALGLDASRSTQVRQGRTAVGAGLVLRPPWAGGRRASSVAVRPGLPHGEVA
ncbi:HNH endonuclease [Streptomyces sp. RKAG293]|uniref:HNH endonuclease n=1 Tax=Streptomyces sp. RKAG293 TaxID=2893403 RepID=UPI0027E44E3F|nr:HNH endonuclease [Streptomyces sp. RKAG293]